MDVAASTRLPQEQASRVEDHVPAVAQSKALHDEDAEEEQPTDHSSPASSSSLVDEAADQSPRAEADAARAPEGKAPDGDESSAMGLTAEQEQLPAMLDSVVVEQGNEERGEEEATNEGKAGDGEGKEEGEKRRRERSRSGSSGGRRSGAEVRPPIASVRGGRGTTASSSTAPRKPKQRSAKQAACAALVKKESHDPPDAVDDNEFTVEAVVDECTRRGEVFVKWEGYSDDTNTWEEKQGFISTAPIPYREFLQRAELEGRLITASGPCQCRRCEGEVENEEKEKKRKKRKRRIESSADEESSDSYQQDDADTLETERMWRIRHARAVRAEKAKLMTLYYDDDDDDDDPIGKDENEQEEWIRGQQKSKPRPRDRYRGTSEEPILID